MTRVDRLCIAVVIAAVSYAPAASAQSAEAEVLFRDGRNLIKHGKLAAGCDKLGASERLESSVGTLLNVGDCREKLGRFASAWAAFRKAEAMAKRAGGDDKRQAEAGRRAAQLEPRMSNLVIQVAGRVDGLVVRRDGEVVDPALWGTALPIDPGSYAIIAEAPGYVAWRSSVPITADSRRQVVVVPALVQAPAPEPVATAAVAPADSSVSASVTLPVIKYRGTWSTTRKLAVVMAVAGAGAAGTGVYFGLHAKDLQDRADRRCPTDVCGDPEGVRLNGQAQTSANRANVLYIAGGAAVAAATLLWLVGAPGETVVTPSAGGHQFGISMTGSF